MFRKILDFDGFSYKRDIFFFFFFLHLRYEFETLSDARSVNDLLDLINMFLSFSGVNFSLTRKGSLNEVKTAICWIKCIDMTKEAVNILGIFIHLIKKLNLRKFLLKKSLTWHWVLLNPPTTDLILQRNYDKDFKITSIQYW